MSYEKINDLIDQAPAVSQWWVSNKNYLNRWVFGKIMLQLPALSIACLGGSTTLLSVGLFGLDGPLALAVSKGWILIVGPLVFAGGFKLNCLIEKNFLPKRFTYGKFKLTEFVGSHTTPGELKYEVFVKFFKISTPQTKTILERLRIVEDMDLPKCWWEALGNELEKSTPEKVGLGRGKFPPSSLTGPQELFKKLKI